MRESKTQGFSFAPLCMLFLPHVGISYFLNKYNVWAAAMLAVGTITGLCLLLFVARNWAELVAGILGSFLLIALLSLCTLIPFIGWIAGVLIVFYTFGSILASIKNLIPYAAKALAIWGVFLISLFPAVFHPVASPVVVFLLCVGLGSALAKKANPFDEFIFLMSSVPLLGLAIASLGKLLQSGTTMKHAQFQQNVSGYTTHAGVQVDSYARTITKAVAVPTTSINPSAAAVGAVAGKRAKDEADS